MTPMAPSPPPTPLGPPTAGAATLVPAPALAPAPTLAPTAPVPAPVPPPPSIPLVVEPRAGDTGRRFPGMGVKDGDGESEPSPPCRGEGTGEAWGEGDGDPPSPMFWRAAGYRGTTNTRFCSWEAGSMDRSTCMLFSLRDRPVRLVPTPSSGPPPVGDPLGRTPRARSRAPGSSESWRLWGRVAAASTATRRSRTRSRRFRHSPRAFMLSNRKWRSCTP